ncbi:pimeloyl-ACP methyl ester carboxylesterase [Williamsia limnetica]|uniref:Pimeloyl-ACP methyl ester carboxylesterase n=1 Tax=Williamsia limnetica TaxID=882452 RepID=A0A318RA06_WILLI|nr:alpha/beta hydrolase [Williamsia limnetica]PYE12478.1 pimeloyl-ACP methyl ester carboxylesterase [Williamsia limnetica]
MTDQNARHRDDAASPGVAPTTSWTTVANQTISVDGTDFVYRAYGPTEGTPVVFLNHLGATLDNWDPRVVDGIAAKHRVLVIDNRGVGGSGGTTPATIEEMAHDAIAVIDAFGYEKVDLLGFSMGGFIAQVIAAERPALVRKLILAGTGPAGGEGIDKVTRLTYTDSITAVLTGKDPKQNLFFTRTANGKAQSREFITRLGERATDRDKKISLGAFRTQLRAIHTWGLSEPADLSLITQPALVANGDDDRMVPTSNTYDLARRLPNATLRIYTDAGHGGIFQAHDQFVPAALEFLAA